MEENSASSNEGKKTNPEVSLPGSDINSIKSPAILQVLSPLNAPEEDIDQIQNYPANRTKLLRDSSSEKLQSHNVINDTDKSSDKNLVSSSINSQSTSHLVVTTPTSTPSLSPNNVGKFDAHPFPETSTKIRQDNVLDIESHLIETYNELYRNDESVGINELPPAEDELQIGCSKIETDDNVRTVIEVEPAKVVTKKPIEKIIDANEPLQATQIVASTVSSNGENCANKDDIENIAKELIANITEEISSNWEEISSQATNKEQIQAAAEATNLDGIKDNLVLEDEKTTGKENENLITHKSDLVKSSLSEARSKAVSVSNGNTDEEINDSLAEEKLSEVVNQHLSEVNSILDSQKKLEESYEKSNKTNSETVKPKLKVVSVPLSKTASEEEERKLFIESLPPLEDTKNVPFDANQLALDCKREYYQSLKKYLVQNHTDKPPLPLQTYRWEDLRRAKERGGYPWTHLYKRPLGPDEEPEIVLMLRKSQEIRFTSESPKSNKKVRIDDHVSIQETERYIQELSGEEDESNTGHVPSHQPDDLENHSLHSESFSYVSDSILTSVKQPKKSSRFSKVRRLFRRRRYGARRHDDAQSLPDSFSNTSLKQSLELVSQESQSQLEQDKNISELKPKTKKDEEPTRSYVPSKAARCFPIMKKLKCMADRQKKRFNIKRIHLNKDEQIVLSEEPKILKLKNSPKSLRGDIPHFIEKQDSDDVLEIVELDESPSRKRRDDGRVDTVDEAQSSIVKPEEIIEISAIQSAQIAINDKAEEGDLAATPPRKAPRLRREHVYEEIDQPDDVVKAAEELKFILDATSVNAIKQSLATQDTSAVKEVTTTNNNIPLDRMGSSEEEPITLADRATPERRSNTLLAPISSIDSASSDEDRTRLHLQPVTEEETEQEPDDTYSQQGNIIAHQETDVLREYKPALKKEASPAPSEKKVTFSHVEDESEPHREDIELTADQLKATKEATKWKNTIK